MKELNTIQSLLNAPKGQYNNFGGYRYRSCEDILAALKPLLADTKCTLTISDVICQVGDRFYIKATATLRNEAGETESTTAFAREALTKKGMDESQVTGAASSYARKYALNGLFAIDDTKDADYLNTSDSYTNTAGGTAVKPLPADQRTVNGMQPLDMAINMVRSCTTKKELLSVWTQYQDFQRVPAFVTALSNRKKELNIA